MDLTGTKYGCGMGFCGSCTVHVNGKAVRSCQTRMSTLAGAKVVTIEALSPNGTHPVQKAWQSCNVAQCGYCQPGMIMTAAALLASNPKPTDQQIDETINQNICRSGTYQRICEAVKVAAGGAK